MSDLKSRMEVSREQQLIRIKELELMYPKKRKEIAEKFDSLEVKIKGLLEEYELLRNYFVNENDYITELGKIGRAVNMDFGIYYLQTSMGFFNTILESLNRES